MPQSLDLQQRLAFLGLEPADLEILRDLRPALEERSLDLVGAFYRHLLAFPPTRRMLRDPGVRERLLEQQQRYLLSLAGPEVNDAYVADRRRIGVIHEKVGLEPRWYLGAYALYGSLLTPIVHEVFADDPERSEQALVALLRLLTLDAELALETYIESRERDLERLNAELAASGRELADRYEAQHRQLHQTTQRARAAEKLASIGTLVAGLAHEIGTPMGVIQGHAKLLEKAVSDDKARWRLTTIQAQIGRISKIIQALLNMARPKASERLTVDLEALVENTLSFLTEKLHRKGVKLVRDFGDVTSVEGDPERLQQLLLNLFMNAADAMPDGGELRVGLQPADDGGIWLRVSDSGVGIPEPDLAHIFDPFFTSKGAGTGNGLGLTVVSGIVADHGGRIDVASEVGDGTEFTIWLPQASGSA